MLGLTLECQVQVKPVYVKGYGVNEHKISEIMKVDLWDGRIDVGVQKILNYVDRESPWLLSGRSLDGCSYIVISFGKDAFSNNLEELEKKDLPSPKYLQAMDVLRCLIPRPKDSVVGEKNYALEARSFTRSLVAGTLAGETRSPL